MQLGSRIGFRSGGRRLAFMLAFSGLASVQISAQDGIIIRDAAGTDRDEIEAPPPVHNVRSVEAERMQAIGDSLLQAEKPLAALAMFRGVEKRTYEPCQLAQAFRGIAQAQARALNVSEARLASDQAEMHLHACDNETRLQLVKDLAEVRIHLGQEEAAERLVRAELPFHPDHPELRALLARIAFIQGNWYATREAVDAVFEVIAREGATDQNLAWLQTMSTQSYILEHLAFPDSLQRELLTALAPLPLDQRIKHREDVLKVLGASKRDVLVKTKGYKTFDNHE